MSGGQPNPSSLVRGRFVEYAPDRYVRTEQVFEVTVLEGGKARLTTLNGKVFHSPHPVAVLLQAVNLSLRQPEFNAGAP